MKITSQQYASALFELVKGNKAEDLEHILKSFSKMLISRNDHFKASRIFSDFEELWYREFSVVKAEVKSARQLSRETIKVISAKLKDLSQAKELLLEEKIDPVVIGGAVIKYGDKILDAGLKNRLDKFKESLAI